MHKISYAAAVGALVTSLPANAETFINCTSVGAPDVVISLNARTDFGHVLSCINSNLISDIDACAPANGYGLSSSMGVAQLVGVVLRWQDYSKHMGPVASFTISPTAYYFSGGFNVPGGGLEEVWRFQVSRITGDAKFTPKGKPPISYICHVGQQKF